MLSLATDILLLQMSHLASQYTTMGVPKLDKIDFHTMQLNPQRGLSEV